MAMGDTVVFEDEVDAAMDAAFAHNPSGTGLHDHFFFRPAEGVLHAHRRPRPGCATRTWAAFSDSETGAAIDGDFIMTTQEVQHVLQALRKAGLQVAALHNHMINEERTLYFTHSGPWARPHRLRTGPAPRATRGLP